MERLPLAPRWPQAVAQGHADAQKDRDIVERRLTAAQIADVQKLVAEWKPKK